MSPKAPMVKLNNGLEMPVLGLGTWLSKEGEGVEAIKAAIDAGYRHIDTAYFYQNEKEVGEAIRAKIEEGVVCREDLFVTTKFIDWDTKNLMPYDADGKLQFSDVDYIDTWKAMEKLLKTGKVKSIGVSNFNSEQITRLLAECEIKPVTNQVECNPSLNQRKLTEFCKNLDITLTAYSPLGRPNYYEKDPDNMPKPALDDPKVIEIGKKYNKTSGQVILRYLVDIGTIPIPKSSNSERIRQNIDIFDFKLTEEEIKIMDGFHTGQRTVPFNLCTSHKYFPFNAEF
ncbi:AAEL004086-PA [Aedes aegypti]|uniref:AAEL004086-PA n=1 Tax=Aedes aegypti TaxID=7159 RepID=Q17DN1_AEDAE|nr:AAEL004086-PA [Aedes aegypti]